MNDREKGANEWFRKGTEAMNHKNWGYAVECFASCAKLVPDNVLYRQTRHGCIRKQYGDNGTGAKMAGMRLMGVKGRIKKCRLSKDWKGVEAAAEEGLETNPWDAHLMFELGEAAIKQDNNSVGRYGLERAVEYDKDNVDYNRTLGRFLFDVAHDYKASRICWERIYKLVPTDGEARSMMSRCDAESTMQKGYDTAESTRDVKTDQPKAPLNAYEADRQARRGAPKSADAPGESAESDLLHAIRKEPQNLNHYLKLADHYESSREFGKAQDQLNKALEISGDNADIKERLQSVQLMVLKNELAESEERVKKNPGKERLVEKVTALKSDLLQREIEFLTHSVQSHPNDMRKKLELAQRYRSAKQSSKAIPLLQQAVSDPRLKVEALVTLGECFIDEKKLDLARRQFEKALEGLSAQDAPDSFKTAHYFLGRIYEKAGKVDEAETHYSEIIAVDYEYKDALKRMEGLQGGDEGPAAE